MHRNKNNYNAWAGEHHKKHMNRDLWTTSKSYVLYRDAGNETLCAQRKWDKNPLCRHKERSKLKECSSFQKCQYISETLELCRRLKSTTFFMMQKKLSNTKLLIESSQNSSSNQVF